MTRLIKATKELPEKSEGNKIVKPNIQLTNQMQLLLKNLLRMFIWTMTQAISSLLFKEYQTLL